jgi:hypothetical protein
LQSAFSAHYEVRDPFARRDSQFAIRRFIRDCRFAVRDWLIRAAGIARLISTLQPTRAVGSLAHAREFTRIPVSGEPALPAEAAGGAAENESANPTQQAGS